MARLRLEPYAERHREAFLALVGDPEVMAPMDGALAPEAASALFDRFLRADRHVLLTRAAFIGEAYAGHGFVVRGEDGPELGFCLRRPLWGRGHGRELAALMIEEAQELGPLWATVDIDNAASIRILEGTGFERRRRGRDEAGDYLVYSRG